MRLATFEHRGNRSIGAVEGDTIVDLVAASDRSPGAALPGDMLSFIEDADVNLERARQVLDQRDPGSELALADVTLLSPIPRPKQNVLCVGRNYFEHLAEARAILKQDLDVPVHPMFFTKRATAVTGPDASIPWRSGLTDDLDWEAELAVVLKRGGADIEVSDAASRVFGYTCLNDISAREVQQRRHNGQYMKGKSFDGFCPMGPWIVTADEFAAPVDLQVICRINGVVKQDSRTSLMIFDVPTIISELSQAMSLEAGEVIATGTPNGVGIARDPVEALRPGDVVETEIVGIGVLRNVVVDATPSS